MKWEHFTPTEEKKLACRARRGDLTARNRLAVSLLHIPIREAKSHYGSDFADFIQAGAEILLEKVATVHPKRLRLPVRRAQSDEAAQMYKPYAIPYHLLCVLGKLNFVWGKKCQELKRLPSPADLVDDLRQETKKLGHIHVDEANIASWLQMADLPTSFEKVEPIISAAPDFRSSDTESVSQKIVEIITSHPRSKEVGALRLTAGLGGSRALTQREAAKRLGCSQRTVSNHVRGAMAMLANDPRVYMLYEELKDLEEY